MLGTIGVGGSPIIIVPQLLGALQNLTVDQRKAYASNHELVRATVGPLDLLHPQPGARVSTQTVKQDVVAIAASVIVNTAEA